MSCAPRTASACRLLGRACAGAALIAAVLAPGVAAGDPAAAAPLRPAQPDALAKARSLAVAQVHAMARAQAVTQTRAVTQTQTRAVALAQTPAVAGGRAVAPAAAVNAPAWLREINRYRQAAGLAAVTAQAAWVTGIKDHLRYMARTPATYMTGPYASQHTENPRSPYYTRLGATEARASDLFKGAVGFTRMNFVTGWLSSPFHAIGMLRPALRQVAFASRSGTGDAGLDVISGLIAAAPDPGPVLFPGPGITTSLLTYGGSEMPNPLQTCNWSGQHQHGLPLIALLPTPPGQHLTATLRPSAGRTESTARGTICLVDEHSYHSIDPVYGPAGAKILAADHAVVLIPLHPLRPGSYRVTIQQAGRPAITWSFSAV
jgi:uncharacterized protein YkwD